ncbi:group I intron protein [Staphylococcus phage vB_SauH_SPJ2]|nr:group I intron protein [Staphylococcus phage vB_SauH_SPJ2]
MEYDNMKREYTKDKGYHLIEIPYKYTTIEDIEEILNKVLV